ncbi:MAG: MFS transporter [Candidatus Heimdallarchaeota archaeon]
MDSSEHVLTSGSAKSDLVQYFLNDIRHAKKKLYGASLTSVASTNLVFSFFHLYAVDLGSTPLIQSIITSQNQLGNTALQPYFGSRSDEKGRRPYLMLGWGTLAITNFLVMLFQLLGLMTVSLLLLILVFQTVLGSAWIPAWTAYLGDITTKKMRGRFVGKVTAVGTIFSIGVILSVGWLMELVGGARVDQYIIPFGIATLLMACSCFFVTHLPESLHERSYHTVRPSIRKILKANPQFRKFTAINACAMFAMSMTWPLYSFVYRDVVNISPTQLVLVSSAFTLTTAISQQWGGRMADKLGRRPGLILGRLFLTAYPILIALSKTWTTILIAELCSGIGSGLAMTLTSVAILDLTREEAERGKFTATSNFIIGVVTFLGALFSGALTQALAAPLGQLSAVLFMLYMAAVLRFVTALLFFRIPETLVAVAGD